MPVTPIPDSDIVITASRLPESRAKTPASVTVIDAREIERLGEPLARSFLRLVPSAAVSSSGPAGSLTDVRIRGAEANHTLLFIDGIRANDPATGDQPRFDILNADAISRIEIVRGPQSALWGSDAIGGVVTVNGVSDASVTAAEIEAGSFGFARGSASSSVSSRYASFSATVAGQRATGIDSFGGGGDKDGYDNLAARMRADLRLAPDVHLVASGFTYRARSQFDGFNPAPPYQHMDTLDNSLNRLSAGRIGLDIGAPDAAWSGSASASYLTSSNRNFLARAPINRTAGARGTVSAQLERRFSVSGIGNQLILAGEAEHETFQARDTIYGGFSDQDRSRDHQAVTLEWRAGTDDITADAAIRRDMFNRFRDSTALRASLLGRLGGGFSMTASYAEGIAQPTFFDLYGFFPGSFVGNPTLRPERSAGFELSIRYKTGPLEAALTGYRQRLHDEIVDIFDPIAFTSSTANSQDVSHRSGIEAEFSWKLRDRMRLSANYSFLHATEPKPGFGQIKELRRPTHSGSIAVDGALGKLTYGISIAYVGAHLDNRDSPPFETVDLKAYWIAGARVAYEVKPGLEIFARTENAINAHYEDVFGYRTEGRGVYAGVRIASRR